jgi:hypothetical protein
LFELGEFVRCINDTPNSPDDLLHFDKWVVKGQIYSIRGVAKMLDGIDGLYLNEINGVKAFAKDTQEILEFSFDSLRFEKIGG